MPAEGSTPVSKRTSIARVLACSAILVLALYLFAKNLDVSKVREGLANANLPLLGLSILLGYFGHLSLRSWRWAAMLQPMLHPRRTGLSFYNLFSTTAIGISVSGLAPGRLGEIVRPLLLARREDLSVAGVLGTTAIERILDLAAIAMLAAAAAVSAPWWWQTDSSPVTVVVPVAGAVSLVDALTWFGALSVVGCGCGFALLRSLVVEDSRFLRLVRRRSSAPGRMAVVWSAVGHLAEGAAFLREGRRTLVIVSQSLALWLLVASASWIGLLAAGVHIPPPGILLIVAVSVLGLAIPTPGGVGTVHVAFQRGLIDLFGVEANLAAVATVLYHPITIYIPPILFGLVFAWRDGVNLSGLRALSQTGKAMADGSSEEGDFAQESESTTSPRPARHSDEGSSS
jgi:uncharacterized membrane protein YbhN (UPF0104 family)